MAVSFQKVHAPKPACHGNIGHQSPKVTPLFPRHGASAIPAKAICRFALLTLLRIFRPREKRWIGLQHGRMCIYYSIDTHGNAMRTNIEIDNDLIAKAMSLSGLTTKRETVEEALRLLVRLKSQEAIRGFRGRLAWDGNLEDMRSGRDPGR